MDKPEEDYICTALLISYNHIDNIRLAIESVLWQKTQYNYIIHIFDDGSTDGTADIIRKYAGNYPDKIIPFLSDTNKGAHRNYLIAYESVTTKYCALLECDDYWCDEEKLQLQIDALEQNPECSCCAHNTLYENINDSHRKKEHNTIFVYNSNIHSTGKYSGDDFKLLTYAGWLNHFSSRVIRMSCIELDSLEDKENFLYDNAQFFYLLSRGSLYYIERIMSVYRMNTGSSFTSLAVQKKISGHFKRLLSINEYTNDEFERLIYRHLASFARYWLRLDDMQQGIIKKNNSIMANVVNSLNSLVYDIRVKNKMIATAKENIRNLNERIMQ